MGARERSQESPRSECPLCQIETGSRATPFEHLLPTMVRTDQILATRLHALAVIDVAPIGPGHSIVITKRHRLSMGAATAAELRDVEELLTWLAIPIGRIPKFSPVFFEHGQRDEVENPFGCSIAHAHVHAVGTRRGADLDLDAIPSVNFTRCERGIANLPSVTQGRHYLYAENNQGSAWIAFPSGPVQAQLLRRHFLEEGDDSRDLKWNWSDQLIFHDVTDTRRRVLENLKVFND